MTNTRKALITGITGMVGSHLLDFLLVNTNWDIHGICRWRSPLDNISHHSDRINRRERISLHLADITDYMSLEKVFVEHEFDFVFHLAAQSYPHTSFTSPNDTYMTNINGTENILKSIHRHSPDSVVHVCSSSEVFGRVPPEFVPKIGRAHV